MVSYLTFFFHMAFISHQSNEIAYVIGLLPLFMKSIHIFKFNNILIIYCSCEQFPPEGISV